MISTISNIGKEQNERDEKDEPITMLETVDRAIKGSTNK